MQPHALEEWVGTRAGGIGPEEVTSAVTGVLRVLAALLEPIDREVLASRMPSDLAGLLRHPGSTVSLEGLTLEKLFDRVAHEARLTLPRAVEATMLVVQGLVHLLDDSACAHLSKRLPTEWIDVLCPPPANARVDHLPPARRALPGTGNTLATGRVGSHTPRAEAEARRAHSHSVLANPNPHSDRKISSTRDTPFAGEPSTLAAGRPTSTRPMSEGGD
jgi:uncharacterized protein (DUF2267 family)